MNKKEIIYAVKISILSLALVLGVSSIYAWTGPASAPPGGNVAAPLNTSNIGQIKDGGITVNANGSQYSPGLVVLNGFTGLGISAPTSILHLNSASPTGQLRISMTDASTGTTANDGFAIIKANNDDAMFWHYEPRSIVFGTSPTEGAPAVEIMRINPAGNVGIGNPNPAAKLDVNGQVQIRGGVPGEGKVLTSDANGLARWENVSGGGSGVVFSSEAILRSTGSTEISTNIAPSSQYGACFLTKHEANLGSNAWDGGACRIYSSGGNWKLGVKSENSQDWVECSAKCVAGSSGATNETAQSTRVSFTGKNCTNGSGGNECSIQSSSNVSKVIRRGVGLYDVYFVTPMNSAHYSVTGMAQAFDDRNDNGRGAFVSYADTSGFNPRSTTKVMLDVTGVDSNDGRLWDSAYVSVVVFQ